MVEEKDDLRSALESAIAEHESEPDGGKEAAVAASPEPEAETPTAQAEGDTLPPTAEAPVPVTPGAKDAKSAEPTDKPKSKREKGPTAPIDWTPDERAQFATLPEWAQKRIYDRNQSVEQLMRDTTAHRHISEAFTRAVEPYRAIMHAEGAQNPIQAVEALLQTAATLQMGTPQQKAQRLAQLCTHYGVDIQLLDQSLAGTMPENPEQDRLERMISERMAPVNQLLGQLQQSQQYQQQQVQNVALQTVSDMEAAPDKYPHLEAVRYEMANRLDLAAANNQPLTLDEAYEQSCWSVPTIRQQLIAQQFNGAAQQNQQHIQQKQNAASSIVGTRGGAAGKLNLEELSLREAIAAQMPQGGRI